MPLGLLSRSLELGVRSTVSVYAVAKGPRRVDITCERGRFVDVQSDGAAQARQWHPHTVPPWPLPHSSTGSGVISLASR